MTWIQFMHLLINDFIQLILISMQPVQIWWCSDQISVSSDQQQVRVIAYRPINVLHHDVAEIV